MLLVDVACVVCKLLRSTVTDAQCGHYGRPDNPGRIALEVEEDVLVGEALVLPERHNGVVWVIG